MNPMLMPMILWQQAIELWTRNLRTQTEMSIRMLEALSATPESCSAERLARNAEALRAGGSGAAKTRPRGAAAKAAPRKGATGATPDSGAARRQPQPH